MTVVWRGNACCATGPLWGESWSDGSIPHAMETISTSLSPSWGESTGYRKIPLTKGAVMGTFIDIFVVSLNMWINDQVAGGFETPWRSYDCIV